MSAQSKAMWWTAGLPPSASTVRAVRVRWLRETLRTMRSAPVGGGDAARAHQAERIGELEAVAGLEREDAAAEQDPGVELVAAPGRCATWSMRPRPASAGTCAGRGVEDEVGGREAVAPSAVGTKWTSMPPGERIAGRRSSPAPSGLSKRADSRRSRARPRAARRRENTPTALTHAPCSTKRSRASEPGSALTTSWISPWRKSVTCFERCWPMRRSRAASSSAAERGRAASSTPNSMKAKPPSVVGVGGSASSTRAMTRRAVASPSLEPAARLALEPEQRAHRVDRGAPVRRLAKDVVEDLERERSGVARAQHLLEEADDVELALAGKVAEVARPLQHVHRQQRRVGHLDEEDPLAGHRRDRRWIVAERRACGSCRGSGRDADGRRARRSATPAR